MRGVRPVRGVAAALVAIAMLHAVADAARACEHDRPVEIVSTATHSDDAHAGHHGHGAPEESRDVQCEHALQCCLATTTCTLAEVATVAITEQPLTRIAEYVDAAPRSLILPPEPPPPRA